MIILSKKRILLVLSCFICSVLSFCLILDDNGKKSETVETASLPISNKVIVVDAGHRNSR